MAAQIHGIYVIENIVTGQKYVGQSIGLLNRRDAHFRELAKGTHKNKKLQADYIKHGPGAFRWRPKLCPDESLSKMEGHWKDALDATYNQASIPKKEIKRSSPTINEIRRQARLAKRRKSTK
jgi:GIY-YIG catalytic domain